VEKDQWGDPEEPPRHGIAVPPLLPAEEDDFLRFRLPPGVQLHEVRAAGHSQPCIVSAIPGSVQCRYSP
jgi:hypothetical protein